MDVKTSPPLFQGSQTVEPFNQASNPVDETTFPLSALKQMQIDRFLSSKYLAHLFGDSFIRDTSHEGWFSTDGLIHIMRLLKDYPLSEKASQVLKNLEQCFYWQGKIMSLLCSDESEETIGFDVHKLQCEISEQIFNLDIGEATLIPGGCQGHIALYEILRTHEDQVQFSVFNLGAGSHKHWILIESEGRSGIQGAYIIEHVPMKIFANQDFLTKLIQLKKTQAKDFGHELYEKILPEIGGQRAPQPQEPTEYMRIQRAGTCAWKTLLAYLRHQLPLDQYKRFKLLARLDVFEKWSALKRTLDLTEITCTLLSEQLVNENQIASLNAPHVEFSREQLLVLGLIKVRKTFQRYHFLLTQEEKMRVKKWYEDITGRDVEKDWKVSIIEKNAEHFEKFA